MGTSMDVRFGQDCRDRTGMGSPIGGSPTKLEPNLSSLYRNAWELLNQWWDSNGGSSVERGLKLIKPLASPPKLTSIRLAFSKSLYLPREQKIRYLQVTTCRELFPTTVAVDTLLLNSHQAISSNHAVNSNPPPDFIWDFSLNTIRVFPNDERCT